MKKITRRSFARDAMVAVTAAALLPQAIAQTQPTPAPAIPASSQAEVDARVQWINMKYGSRLNDEQRADVRRIIAGGQASVDTMRQYDLENGSGPAEPFRIYRKAAKK
jgi:hypothetical protein